MNRCLRFKRASQRDRVIGIVRRPPALWPDQPIPTNGAVSSCAQLAVCQK